MTLRSTFSMLAVLAAAGFIASGSAIAAEKAKDAAKPATCAQMKVFDPDNDGTMDLPEAKNAATALFDKLNKDKDKDSTLEIKELQGRLSKKEFTEANPDNDGTLDKNEYLAVVEKRFKAANPDSDTTIDCKELGTKEGKALVRVLK